MRPGSGRAPLAVPARPDRPAPAGDHGGSGPVAEWRLPPVGGGSAGERRGFRQSCGDVVGLGRNRRWRVGLVAHSPGGEVVATKPSSGVGFVAIPTTRSAGCDRTHTPSQHFVALAPPPPTIA